MAVTTGAIYSSPSSQDPSGIGGFAGAGSLWQQTDTYNLYVRDVTNTSWVLLGLTNTQNLGLLPKAGGALTGAITGATGLQTSDGATPYTSAPVVTGANSANLATLNDLANLQNNLYNLVQTSVQQAMAGIPTAGISANMAFAMGRNVFAGFVQGTATFQLPTPVYSDGTNAPIADCLGKYFAGITGFSVASSSVASGVNDVVLFETSPNSMNYTISVSQTTGATPSTGKAALTYFVLAIKPGS